MGMYLELLAVSDVTIARLEADPPLAWRLVTPDEPERVAAARDESRRRPGLFARLLGRREPPPPPPPPPFEVSAGEGGLGPLGDFEKSWHALHYLLTGTAWEGEPPLNFLLAGGLEIDPGLGVPPLRAYSSRETREIAGALGALDVDGLRARFDPAEMQRLEIYPEIWDRAEAWEYLVESFGQLRHAVETVGARGHGLLVAIA